MTRFAETLNRYKELNESVQLNSTVFFGADWLCNIPLLELSQTKGLETVIYNRSIKGLKMSDAENAIETCVCNLHPTKLFVNIGENDIMDKNFCAEKFIEKYEWLLYTLHLKCNCAIYVLSVTNDKYNVINWQIKDLAMRHGYEYVDLETCKTSPLDFFHKIRFFLRTRPLSFLEAMTI